MVLFLTYYPLFITRLNQNSWIILLRTSAAFWYLVSLKIWHLASRLHLTSYSVGLMTLNLLSQISFKITDIRDTNGSSDSSGISPSSKCSRAFGWEHVVCRLTISRVLTPISLLKLQWISACSRSSSRSLLQSWQVDAMSGFSLWRPFLEIRSLCRS